MQLHVQLLLTGADSGQLTTARKQWRILIILHGIQVGVVPHHHPRGHASWPWIIYMFAWLLSMPIVHLQNVSSMGVFLRVVMGG